jgi:porin
MSIHKSLLSLTITALLVASSAYADEDNGANFGSPDAVDNQIAEDNKSSKPSFKTQLEQNNISMGVDYSVVYLGASNVLPGADSNAATADTQSHFFNIWRICPCPCSRCSSYCVG